MSDSPDAFARLAPFIQEFIWKRGWSEMREIQVRAAAAAFDSQKNLLLAAGTASGKTEAAFLPILTQLHDDPPEGVGALYIGPLKALINDQFVRLDELCEEAGIPVTAWHGDASVARKNALLKNPAGILQITPESLEGLLLNRSRELVRLFGDLRWVVIDEVHAFMASDRGGQVLALLDRLARYARDRSRVPRRAGLSATLGDYGEAAAWLDGSTGRGVEVIAEKSGRTVFLLVESYPVIDARDDEEDDSSGVSGEWTVGREGENSDDAGAADRIIARGRELYEDAYNATERRKSLVFTNSRGDAEEVIGALRRIAELRGGDDIYHVHHGSISAELREAAEAAMRDPSTPACTAATVTLELGIDLGQLDRVLQLGPTYSVASFLQRLGRAGRRGQRAEMFFLLREEAASSSAHVLEQLPWQLLQTVALIQLYAEERWIEPIARPALPGSLLYQQTMSVVGATGELSPADLAGRVLTLAPFRNVTEADFRALLIHLLEIDHLERTESGTLMLGLAGERLVRNYRFLATFEDPTEWSVRDGSREIGKTPSPVPPGERLVLAGRTWEVVDLFEEQRVVVVKRVKGSLRAVFTGGRNGQVHDHVVDRMRRVLQEDVVYPYLGERSQGSLAVARVAARAAGIANGPAMLALGGNRFALLPWCGTRALQTLALRLSESRERERAEARAFYLEVVAEKGRATVKEEWVERLAAVAREEWSAEQMIATTPRSVLEVAKYDEFLPESLLRRGFAADRLDVATARAALERTIAARVTTASGPE